MGSVTGAGVRAGIGARVGAGSGKRTPVGAGFGKRALVGAAIALVCAVTVLGAPGAAYASPKVPAPTPAPTPTGGGAAAETDDEPTDDEQSDGQSDEQLQDVQKELDKLYRDAAVATDAYNAAEEKADQQSARIAELDREIAKGREKLAGLKDCAGAAARAQYRSGGGLPPEAQLWLSDDPQEFLEGASRLRQGQQATTGLIAETARAQEDLEQYERDAAARWKKLEANRKAKATAKKEVKKRIATAEKLRSRLKKAEQERLTELEQEAAAEAQAAWLDSGVLKEPNGSGGKASTVEKKAVAFATAQLGKPYEWGAEGPDTYDCSGLTSRAWAAAGVTIPRTSQEQWKRLRHVGIQDMRPGDLIIYFDDASHVAMYIGDGMIVHAPRPGRTVTTAGAGSMRILGVVRPDA
ncbi:NLP/P60 protein [Actinobacteria bacterium OK074]|nr:NLP/P60 protein [Actinobacteria bacterium OK074]